VIPIDRPERVRAMETFVVAAVVPLIALVAVLVTFSITDGSTSSAATAGREAGSGTAITIEDFRYSPDPITVATGATITVTNEDRTVHTITADDGKFDTGDLADGAQGTITFDASGTYTYHCDVHNYMTGTIKVR
jgi:plastocyanin